VAAQLDEADNKNFVETDLRRYLPRKFKIAFAVPPVKRLESSPTTSASIAIVETTSWYGTMSRWRAWAAATAVQTSRAGRRIGFMRPSQVIEVAKDVLKNLRDHETGRTAACALKYVVAERGVDGVREKSAAART